MEWVATLRYGRISPRKARQVADLVRGMRAEDAVALLTYTPKKAADMIKKVLESAIGNASQSTGVDEDKLFISRITVDEGPIGRRWRARAMGRPARIRKRTSHITVALEEE